MNRRILLSVGAVLCVTSQFAFPDDADSDGIGDGTDNCPRIYNPLQSNSDNDSRGNRCDMDLNEDGSVDRDDVQELARLMFTANVAADFDASGAVDFSDLAIIRQALASATGRPDPQRGATTGRGSAGQAALWIEPDSVSLLMGETATLDIQANFIDPAIGGGFDLLYDVSKIEVLSWDPAPLGDPNLQRLPDQTIDGLTGFAIGNVAGLFGPEFVGTVTIRGIDAGETYLSLAATTAVSGPFVALNGGLLDMSFSGAKAIVGDVPGPHILVSPIVVNFGRVIVGEFSIAKLTVFSNGDSGLLIGDIDATDGVHLPFEVVEDGCSGQQLSPGSDCHFAVRFDPYAAAVFSDTFTIPSNAVEEPLVTVQLTGSGRTAYDPRINVDAGTYFGQQPVGSVVEHFVRISNGGYYPLELSVVGQPDNVDKPFALFDDDCSNRTLPGAASCKFGLRFTVIDGAWTDTFDIESNDPRTPRLTVGIVGEGVPAAQIDPSGTINGLVGAAQLLCENSSTGQQLPFQIDSSGVWNCGSNGLLFDPLDELTITIRGQALTGSD